MKRYLVVSIIYLLVLSSPVSTLAETRYNNFDASIGTWDGYQYPAGRIVIDTAYARAGAGSLSVTLDYDDALIAAGHRAELQDDPEISSANERWYGASFRLRDQTWPDDNINITQLWKESDQTTCNFTVRVDDWRAVTRNSAGTVANREMSALGTDEEEWQDWVFRVRATGSTATSILQAWKNGTRVLNLCPAGCDGTIELGTGDGGIFKVGIYWVGINEGASFNDPTYGNTVRHWIDELRLDDSGTGSYASVCPTIHPKAPTNDAPASGATGVALNPTLTASAYVAGYAAGDTSRSHITDAQVAFLHLATQLQVDVGVAPTWANPIYNKTVCNSTITKPTWCDEQDTEVGGGSTVSVSSWAVGLTNNTLYSLRMRHANMAYISGTAGVDRDYDTFTPPTDTEDVYWGPWSTVTTFTTGTNVGPPPAGTSNWYGSFTGSF